MKANGRSAVLVLAVLGGFISALVFASAAAGKDLPRAAGGAVSIEVLPAEAEGPATQPDAEKTETGRLVSDPVSAIKRILPKGWVVKKVWQDAYPSYLVPGKGRAICMARTISAREQAESKSSGVTLWIMPVEYGGELAESNSPQMSPTPQLIATLADAKIYLGGAWAWGDAQATKTKILAALTQAPVIHPEPPAAEGAGEAGEEGAGPNAAHEPAWGEAANGLQCRLLPEQQTVTVVKDRKPGDVACYLTYELRNVGDHKVQFTPWDTPLQGIGGTIFDVVDSGGKQAKYVGWCVDRFLPPRRNHYITLAPGQKLSRRFGLPYDMSEPGEYQVSISTVRKPAPEGRYIMGYYNRDIEKAKANPDNVWTGELKSNTVTVTIERPGEPPWSWGEPVNGLQAGLRVRGAELAPKPKVTLEFALRRLGGKPRQIVRVLGLSAQKWFWGNALPIEVRIGGKVLPYKGPVLVPPPPPSLEDFIDLGRWTWTVDSVEAVMLPEYWGLESPLGASITFVFEKAEPEAIVLPYDHGGRVSTTVEDRWTGTVRSGSVKIEAMAALGLAEPWGCGKAEAPEELEPEIAEAIRAVDTGRSLTKDQEEEIGAIVRAYAGYDDEAISAARDRLQEMERDALPSLMRRAVSEPDGSLRRAAFVGVSRTAFHARITQGRAADWVDGLRPFWRRMCRDPDSGIRALAARKLVAFHGYDAVEEVAEIMMAEDPDHGVRYDLAHLLIRLGREDLVPPELAKSIKESTWHVDGILVIPREGWPRAKAQQPEE